MLGVFDSGEGGENAVRELRRIFPTLDITLLKDKANAPFGTKSEGELIRITACGIDRLVSLGCDRILIACCTASAVYGKLPSALKSRSIPIISPTASRAAVLTHSGRIALLATDATVRSHAFGRALGGALKAEIPASRLVDEIERGARDGNISEGLSEYLESCAVQIADCGADVLILGCTHFALLRGEIAKAYHKITKRKIIIVDSAREGARALISLIGEHRGEGRIKRIE